MREDFVKKLTALIEVKSLVTLFLTGDFVYLSITGSIDKADFMMIFGMVITYFFAKNMAKKDGAV